MAAGSSQGFQELFPPATRALLQNLRTTHEIVFPVNEDSPTKPDAGEDDTAAGKIVLQQRGGLIRCILGGWMAALGDEEAKNGAHELAPASDNIPTLAFHLQGILQFIVAHPAVLLLRPSTSSVVEASQLVSQLPDSTWTPNAKFDIGLATEDGLDLATFFLPRILRACASLETSLLSSRPPSAAEVDEAALLYRSRESLRLQLESFLVTIVEVLERSAVSMDWQCKGVAVEGGVGKARELVSEMLSLGQELVPSNSSQATAYPAKILLFRSSKVVARLDGASVDPFVNQPSVCVHSSLHSRALRLTTLRILLRLSTTSHFLSDSIPLVYQQLDASWPTSADPVESVKGKEKVNHSSMQLVDAHLELALSTLKHLDTAFAPLLIERMMQRVLTTIGSRLAREGSDGAPIGRTDKMLLDISSTIWSRVGSGSLVGSFNLRQLFAAIVHESGEGMVEMLSRREIGSLELRLISLLLLTFPLHHSASTSAETSDKSSFATALLSPEHILSLTTFVTPTPSTPRELQHSDLEVRNVVESAWNALRTELLQYADATTALSPRKRKRSVGDGGPTSDAMDLDVEKFPGGEQPERRKKAVWRESVGQVLSSYMAGADIGWESEGLETFVARIARALSVDPSGRTLNTLKALGFVGCAREGTLSHSTPSPLCVVCDNRLDTVSAATPPSLIAAVRIFTKTPLDGMQMSASALLDNKTDIRVRLGFLQATTRLLHHSRSDKAALDLSKDKFAELVVQQLGGTVRSIRVAAGTTLLAIIAAHQDRGPTIEYITALCKILDRFLSHPSPAVVETTLGLIGRIAQIAPPQSSLECQCIARLVSRLGHSNMFLKSVARVQFEQVAHFRNLKPYALVQPHFETISPVLVDSMKTIDAALDCFQQTRETVLRLTREYTLPKLVVENKMSIIKQIADASHTTISCMLVEPATASAILAYIYMRPDREMRAGLTNFMREASKSSLGDQVTLFALLASVRIPLVYRLALLLGDQDPSISTQAERALRTFERASNPSNAQASVDLGVVLKESIVGILSLMNRGLNESTAHQPLQQKEKIIRSLSVVTETVGPAIAGFSPQIMATLQSALEMEGLRHVTLLAFKSFFSSLKFSEVGPFIGTTSATFVRLWADFSPLEKTIAVDTLEYVVLQNPDNLAAFVQDVADLGGIPELERANHRLTKMRKDWSFEKRSDYLLTRIGSENDVVSLQALRELKGLMLGDSAKLQAYAAGDSFDRGAGRLVKVLFGAAAKDGHENESLRNLAFECIGILGALDPDRLELAPSDSTMIVLKNFEEREESIAFALHLVEYLLIGAYRSTNDTKHQEFLAFAIQELLRFCGFGVELLIPSRGPKTISARARERWDRLPKFVLETCGPLLGTSFSFKERPSLAVTTYPIYQHTPSYRDWIRSWATDLIAKLQGPIAKEIFSAFPPVLRLEDITVAQHLLPHLVLTTLISGTEDDRKNVKDEMQKVLEDQVDPKHQLSENSRLLSAQTVFDLMDHLSRWINKTRQEQQKKKAALKKVKESRTRTLTGAKDDINQMALVQVEGILQDIPQILVAQAALTCKAYARSLLNFESRIVAQRSHKTDKDLQEYYENLHECYADLDEPDGMEGITTKIISPSVWHQIREHESTGRWTSAQSCWEVKLQQTPEDPACHIGLLRCLRNLGHYDSMRTHIVGILHSGKENADWDRILAPFVIEASLIVSDWDAVEEALRIPEIDGPEVAFATIITAMRQGVGDQLSKAFYDAREQLGSPIVAAGKESYRRVYDSVINLHILHELETIRSRPGSNSRSQLASDLKIRLDSTSPSFRAREPILNMRRTALSLQKSPGARRQIGELWVETSKIARKAGHSQTAYSAILQANNLDTPFVFLQSAKLLECSDQTHKAIQEIDNALRNILPPDFVRNPEAGGTLVNRGPPSRLAKASLRRARWMHEAGRLDQNGIVGKYQEAIKISPDWESPSYYLGHYWDQLQQAMDKNEQLVSSFHEETVKLFSLALSHGTKFIYQAMPRMLTIWLELGERPDILRSLKLKKDGGIPDGNDYELWISFLAINKMIERNVRKLPSYQWLTVLPQLVSRIGHPNETLFSTLEMIILEIVSAYPHHAVWSMASGAKSQTTKRSRRCTKVFAKAKSAHAQLTTATIDISTIIDEGLRLVDELLALCGHSVQKETTLSLYKQFPKLNRLAPTTLIIPLQTSLNVSLPSDASRTTTHKPFPDNLATFHNFCDEIDIMNSLQKPRKISVWGSDGQIYAFLCKPTDDLRKDARLMEFNSMIIKLLKKDSESRNRRLGIRTYAVVPLNEECGLIEWVPNVVVLRGILTKSYGARGINGWTPELKKIYETLRDDPEKIGERFENEILSSYPPVFHEWFLETFPEPSAWLRARLAYSRTAAVISIVGFVLGLGDRHCENILIEGNTGDTVHVDFNCLFDKGRTFEVPEKVPFRLTHNIIDGMGVTGVEGVFRRAAEITLRVLRDNKESLTSVLETFVHDPLVEWTAKKGHKGKEILRPEAIAKALATKAREHLEPISLKLRGLQVTSDPASLGEKEVSVAEQVERLIREARDPKNLGACYVGWCPWF